MEITAYQTHIEVHPYVFGDAPEIEMTLSKKSKQYHALLPIAYYIDTNTETLYLPRGIDFDILERALRERVKVDKHPTDYVNLSDDYRMIIEPRDDLQRAAIDFLMKRGSYEFAWKYSQFALNLPTGFGKTYCAINALITGRNRAVIICHTKKVRDQWYRGFTSYTNIPKERIKMIDGMVDMAEIIEDNMNDTKYDYYLVLHQTFTSYCKENWNILSEFFLSVRVFCKIIDEAHLYFENSLMLDYFSNVPVTYYLTATFGRSDPQENHIYKIAYSQALRYSPVIKGTEHTISYMVLMNSRPSPGFQAMVEKATSYGFSGVKYMQYELKRPDLINAVMYVLDSTKAIEGKRVITCNLLDGLDKIYKRVRERYPELYTIIINAHSTPEELSEIENADVIIGTTKLLGTGPDIKGLRILINTEVIGSKINAEQLIGRLRPYCNKDGESKNTLFFHIVDTGFGKCMDLYKRVRPTFSRTSVKLFTIEI